MKPVFLWISGMLLAALSMSCEKDSTMAIDEGFIKSVRSDSNMVTVGSVSTADGIIVVCRSFTEKSQGMMYKVDMNGDLLWRKEVPLQNRVLWQVYDLPDGGFTTLGYDDPVSNITEVCFYTDDGNFLYSKQIPWNIPWGGALALGPMQMLRLSTGGYVFTASVYGEFHVLITDNTMDPATQIQKEILLPGNPAWGYGVYPRGICELPDSTILITTAFSYSPGFDFDWRTLVYRLDFLGNTKSMVTIGDSLHNETPTVLLPVENNLLLVTGRMGMTHDGSGIFVNYFNNSMGYLCAGEVNLLRLDQLGQLISRRGIRNYPANGLIINARPTADGGFILCGTVNQSTSLSVISPTRIYLLKVSASGDYQWSRTFSTEFPSYGVDAVQMPDGGYFVTGYEKAFDKHFNAVIIKTDINGNV